LLLGRFCIQATRRTVIGFYWPITICASPPTMTRYWTSQALLLIVLVLLQPSLKADSIPEIVAKAKPAVVEIVTRDATGKPKTLGTGFFVSPDGLVVRNQHVIEGSNSIMALNNNGAIFLLERVVAQPPGVDLVVLKFHATDVPFLSLGKSTTAVEGQRVIVIGNPTGLTGTVSDGIISAFRESRSFIQITAPVSPGSSGSPVMDEDGQVIGVATLQNAEGQNLNFAIPVEKISAALAKPPSERVASSTLPKPTPAQAIAGKTSFDSGKALLEKKEYDKAINAFTDAIRLDPNDVAAYFNRGLAYDNQHKFDEAIRDYTEAIRLDPNDVAAYYGRGLAYYKQHKFDEAIRDYTEAIRLDPNDVAAYVNRGGAYYGQRKFHEAIRDYTEAIRLDSSATLAYNCRGIAYADQGDLDSAIHDFTDAIRLDPNDAAAYFNRGLAYYNQHKLDEAVRDCNEAIRIDPNHVDAYNLRGSAYADRGKLDEAKADFATADRLKAGQ
jgi:tetratricopeptide (TPR) repeat protein